MRSVPCRMVLAVVCVLALPAAAVLAGEALEDTVLRADGKLRTTAQAQIVPGAPAPTEQLSRPLSAVGGVLMLLGLVGVAILLLRSAKKKAVKLGGDRPTLELVERLALGQRREIILMRVCNQLLILSSTQQEVKLLSELSASDPLADTADAFDHQLDAREVRERLSVKRAVAPTASAVEVNWPTGGSRNRA